MTRERKLINIMEDLALSEIERQLSHRSPFYQTDDRVDYDTLVEPILNQLPAIYLWMAEDECPDLMQLTPTEQQQLRQVVQQVLQHDYPKPPRSRSVPTYALAQQHY